MNNNPCSIINFLGKRGTENGTLGKIMQDKFKFKLPRHKKVQTSGCTAQSVRNHI
jgi:hypothetical protein